MSCTAFPWLPASYLWALCLWWVLFVPFIPGVAWGQSTVVPPQPQSFRFQPVTLQPHAQVNPAFPNTSGLQTIVPANIAEQNRRMLQQGGMLPGPGNAAQVQQQAEIEREVMETGMLKADEEWVEKTKSYRGAYAALSRMNPDSFSLTKAVFLVEDAYLDDSLSFRQFDDAIQRRAEMVRQIVARKGLDKRSDLALNYGIQQLYEHPNQYYYSKTGRVITVPPFRYDLFDFRGEKDYTKMFVSKLLATGSGQCHSMPLLYLLIAEHLGSKAWLSLAPQHSFIQFEDDRRQLLNFESTNGNLVSNNWMIASGFITTEALQRKTYLDTLSRRQLYAQMLSDLLLGYLHKFPFDDLAETIKQRILQLNPQDMTALIVDANLKTELFLKEAKLAGLPKRKDLPKYPGAYRAFLAMNAAYRRVDDLGYQDMPKEAYQRWLQSIETEKKKQASREMQERMAREIQYLKVTQSKLTNKIKS